MTEPRENERILEARVHAALRRLPLRRAPASLAARVEAEIARRAALPWWRRSFAAWPSAARIGFVVASLALVGVFVLVMVRMPPTQQPLPALTALPGIGQVQALLALGQVLRSAALHALPAGWLTAGLALSGALYALLFGLGAASYRALCVPLQVNR